MKHSESGLVMLRKPSEYSSVEKGVSEIWGMVESEFTLSTNDIATYLHCKNDYVNKYVRNNVKHIFLNKKIKLMIHAHSQIWMKDYIYYSKNDFENFISKNIKKINQTITIPLNILGDSKAIEKIESDYFNKKIEDDEYEIKLYNVLSNDGKKIWNLALKSCPRSEVPEIEVPFPELPKEFLTIADIKEYLGYNSNELVYRFLFNHGCSKYKLFGNKTLIDKSEFDRIYKVHKKVHKLLFTYETVLENQELFKQYIEEQH